MSSSSSSSVPGSSSPPQAGPIPPKVGELAYVGRLDGDLPTLVSNTDARDMALRPHPAELTDNLPTPSSHTPSIRASPSEQPTVSITVDSASITRSKKSQLVRLFRCSGSRPMPSFQGIRLATCLRVSFIVLALIGMIVAWALTVTVLQMHKQQTTTAASTGTGQSVIFIHITFGFFTALLLLFLERAIFLARAERYLFIHALPDGSPDPGAADGPIAYAPWNRPSLPTYATALGYRGTGDVEDAAIAAPPPPEYGNTRGSTLLLTTLLRQQQQQYRLSTASTTRGRPVSYSSQLVPDLDEEEGEDDVEEDDAKRARRFEFTLATLEGGEGSGGVTIPPPAVLRRAL